MVCLALGQALLADLYAMIENSPKGTYTAVNDHDIAALLKDVLHHAPPKSRAARSYEWIIAKPYLLFLPFLCYYAYFIITHKAPKLHGDELRYVEFATNLIHGFYSPNPHHLNLWNGPGYPILLMPFIALKIPAIYMALMNALFQYFALVFLHKALTRVANNKTATLCGLLFAVYPNTIGLLPLLYTEAFTGFLVSSLLYSITLWYTKKDIRYSIIAGIVFGYLALTKVIFGYVIVICLAICIVLLLLKKNKVFYLRNVYILLLACAVTIPYLGYTYYLTGKAFYWGNSGGMSLYWMSTPYAQEYGDWKIPSLANTQYPNNAYRSDEAGAILKKNHLKEVSFIRKHENPIVQDELFKQAAIRHIKNDPFKFLKNYYYNFSRMLFNFPYSYAFQDGAIVGNILRGSLILWASLIGALLTWINWRKISYPVKFILLITAVYLSLSGALSAYPRQLDVMLPALLFWLGFLQAGIKVRLKFRPQKA
jgi:hypothetical protein